MRVLLTGANGFLGSHIMDVLLDDGGYEVSVLLRCSGDTRFIGERLNAVAIHYGALDERESLLSAVANTEAVIHCAAKTKALRSDEYEQVNHHGTRNLIDAINTNADKIRRLLLVSSVAAGGPGRADSPVDEAAVPNPVTPYGRSKLASEAAVQSQSQVPWTILRPPGIYGPRDKDFLPLFKSVDRGWALLPNGGKQELSLAFGPDVAQAVRECLAKEEAAGSIYNVAGEPPCTVSELAQEIGRAMNRRLRALPVPNVVLYAACVAQDVITGFTRRPHILSREKWPELSAPGWVCATQRIRDEIGFAARTSLVDGLAQTVAWYRREGWI